MANSRSVQIREAEYKNSLRIPFHDTFQYRRESNLILPNSRFPRFFQLTRLYLSHPSSPSLPLFLSLPSRPVSLDRSCFRGLPHICSFHVQTSRSCLSTHFNLRTKLPGVQHLQRFLKLKETARDIYCRRYFFCPPVGRFRL